MKLDSVVTDITRPGYYSLAFFFRGDPLAPRSFQAVDISRQCTTAGVARELRALADRIERMGMVEGDEG